MPMQFFTITLILAIFRLVSANNVTRTNETPAPGLAPLFHLPPWANGSSPPTEVTVQINFGDLSGSAIITLINSSVSTSRRVGNPFTFFSNTTMYPGPYMTTNLTSCATHPVYNATRVSAGFAKPTGNINATAGSSGRPFATPTPTDFSLFSSGAISKKGNRNAFLSAIITLSYFL
ncbi:hypothetical protein CC78DRAFT_586272 [Lojkania enalia]|uniref:Uncharacterized protein n=1 Tax=Lojkania enalia TaxID=147567 RepID=A0A9P4K1Q4_9PLEO|nr:hypothetical protein CC78DRAFT_586272 [Didymosphaeria enalia]